MAREAASRAISFGPGSVVTGKFNPSDIAGLDGGSLDSSL
ncbi:hypothetical protein ACPOL_2102 [Acidisarcina polymorpha]|uniref:Uncharacterized protein n=1 Tax=Acidisarcina polymorpha TaxID=2211140 RepID=A0A2Z5FX28_9BACT|nr:hypothetical protein ACPOL_2102 [Acidisarcina polymorpha]